MTVVLALTLAALLVVGAVRYVRGLLAEGPRLDAAKAALFVEEE